LAWLIDRKIISLWLGVLPQILALLNGKTEKGLDAEVEAHMNNRRDHHTRDLVGLIEMLSERIAILSFRIAFGVNSDPTGLAVLPPTKIRLFIPKRLSPAVEDLKGKVGALGTLIP
jgi:hypothetical protein